MVFEVIFDLFDISGRLWHGVVYTSEDADERRCLEVAGRWHMKKF